MNLECCTNNKASTVLQYFEQGVWDFGILSRIRGDQGMENVNGARYIIINQGSDSGSFIAGRSAHWKALGSSVVNRASSALYRICLISLREVEIWTHWMNCTCWLCNIFIFLGIMPFYTSLQTIGTIMVLEHLATKHPCIGTLDYSISEHCDNHWRFLLSSSEFKIYQLLI